MVGTTAPATTGQNADVCPVDHDTRAAWLESQKSKPALPSTTCDSSSMDQSLSTPSITNPPPPPTKSLKKDREISTIPRVFSSNGNAESPTDGLTSKNWIYPSEEMFFNAMSRKNWDPKAEDMRTIVPIHNAVNERAWHDIKEWEKGKGSEK